MQGKVNQIVKKSPGKIKREKVNKITFNSAKNIIINIPFVEPSFVEMIFEHWRQDACQ